MKTHISLIATGIVGLMLTIAGCSPKVDVPSQVSDAFTSRYKDAVKVKWSMESDNEYEAEFHLNKVEMSANFTANGQWVETEKEISKQELPALVSKTLDAQYPGYKVEEVALTETTDEGSYYEIEIEKKKDEQILHINMQGQVIKSEVEGDEDGEQVEAEGAEGDEEAVEAQGDEGDEEAVEAQGDEGDEEAVEAEGDEGDEEAVEAEGDEGDEGAER